MEGSCREVTDYSFLVLFIHLLITECYCILIFSALAAKIIDLTIYLLAWSYYKSLP